MIGMFFLVWSSRHGNHIRKKTTCKKRSHGETNPFPVFKRASTRGRWSPTRKSCCIRDPEDVRSKRSPVFHERFFGSLIHRIWSDLFETHDITWFYGKLQALCCMPFHFEQGDLPSNLVDLQKIAVEISLRVAGKSVAIGTSQLRLYLFENTIQSFCSFWEPMVCWRADRWWMVPFFFRRNQAKIVWDISNFLSWFRHFLS